MDEKAELQEKIERLERDVRELSSLLEGSQDVFYRTDMEGRLTFITPSIERYAGYTPAELIGRYAYEVYAQPEDRHKLVEELSRTGSVIDYGIRVVDRTGNFHFVSVNARIFSENGKISGIEGVMRDITRRRLLELAVAENEERFRMLAESSPVGIFLSDADHNCLFVNPKWCELAGMTKEQAMGTGWHAAVHPDDRARVSGAGRSADMQYQAVELDCRFMTPGGKVSFIRVDAAPLTDASGQFAGYVGSLTDLTRLQQAEQVTRNLGSLIESFEDAIIVFTFDGIVLNWNKAAERIYGYSAAEIVGRHADALNLATNHWAEVQGVLDRLLSGTHLAPMRSVRRRKDGVTIHVSITFSLVRDIAGKPIGATSVSRDITQRKAEQDAVQRSEELFHAVFDRGTVGIALLGPELRLERVNPLFAKILGRSESELIGVKISDFTHADDVSKGSQLALSLLRGEIPYYSFEKRYLRKDGGLVWVHLTATSIPDGEGKPTLGLAMIEDISDRKKSEQEREDLIRQLTEALANVKTLTGLLPMCAWCKKIRDDHGSWSEVEVYVQERSDADFTHGICPECQSRVRRDLGMGLK